MAKALSVDLRDRVAQYVMSKHSRREAAKLFGIAVSTVVRFVSLYKKTGRWRRRNKAVIGAANSKATMIFCYGALR